MYCKVIAVRDPLSIHHVHHKVSARFLSVQGSKIVTLIVVPYDPSVSDQAHLGLLLRINTFGSNMSLHTKRHSLIPGAEGYPALQKMCPCSFQQNVYAMSDS